MPPEQAPNAADAERLRIRGVYRDTLVNVCEALPLKDLAVDPQVTRKLITNAVTAENLFSDHCECLSTSLGKSTYDALVVIQRAGDNSELVDRVWKILRHSAFQFGMQTMATLQFQNEPQAFNVGQKLVLAMGLNTLQAREEAEEALAALMLLAPDSEAGTFWSEMFTLGALRERQTKKK